MTICLIGHSVANFVGHIVGIIVAHFLSILSVIIVGIIVSHMVGLIVSHFVAHFVGHLSGLSKLPMEVRADNLLYVGPETRCNCRRKFTFF